MVSEVVSELMLLAIMVSVMGGVLAFSNVTLMPVFTTYHTQAQKAQLILRERVLIEDAWFYTSGGTNKLQVTVYNYGDYPASIVAVYVNGMALTAPATNSIAPGTSRTFTWNYAWTAGTNYQVKVATKVGNVFESAFTA